MSAKYDFTDKKVLVTGASQGIGRSLSIALVNTGAKVFALAKNKEGLESLQAEVPNGGITTIFSDVTAGAEELAEVLKPYQPFHYLVNNAGIAVLESVLDATEDSFDRTIAVNLKAPIFLTQVVAHEMIKHDIKGSIVNISSQASLVPLQNHLTYCASKAGLDMASRCLAKELGPKGIRVNCVNPTVVMTEMGRAAWSDPVKASTLLDRMPLKRFAELQDVNDAVFFLLSDASGMTTGHTLPVDGGFINQ